VRDTRTQTENDIVLGDEWVDETPPVLDDSSERPKGRNWRFWRRSALTRKIVTFNLIALNVLVAGVLYLNASRDNLAQQRAKSLTVETQLIASVIEAETRNGADLDTATAEDVLGLLPLTSGVTAHIFDASGKLLASGRGVQDNNSGTPVDQPRTLITDALGALWQSVSSLMPKSEQAAAPISVTEKIRELVAPAIAGQMSIDNQVDSEGRTIFTASAPIDPKGRIIGVVALSSAAGEIDQLAKIERERVLQLFLIGTVISVLLSLVLASTISNPLSDLAQAAEAGKDKDAGAQNASRVRIPDLSHRPDEIGRLSKALRGMVTALYDRIDANEQFAADVAHEIKNPLASLRSAVGTLRLAKRDDQREKLLDVIDHDVRRLDRLVSDISNASRLDSELVKETQASFDLLKLVRNLTEYFGDEAQAKGIEFITDLPNDPVYIHGLEPRLAQVFVNLISNAISFCEDGDAIRVWIRTRANRVLVVVEDTGPGIPEAALTKVFKRFYSERPVEQFGNNSGLGLAISKQIVEAHDGVIWAENIRPTLADPNSDPLGARFVVGLPV